jgi:hypothetical protein
MNRRDFLLLRRAPRDREVELSCERLYMRCLDTQVTGPHPGDPADWEEPGEPPAAFAEHTRQQLFDDLNRALLEVDVLRVVDSQWLVGDLRHDFDHLIDVFRARGGNVQIR